MLIGILKSFLYLLLLNNFLFKYLLGVDLVVDMKNSLSEIFRFAVYLTLTFILSSSFYYLIYIHLLVPNNLKSLSIITISSITLFVVHCLSLCINKFKDMKKHLILNVVFLITYMYLDEVTPLNGLIYGILSGVFVFVSFVTLCDLYERIKIKSDKMNPELIYFLSISIISMVLFGFTGLKI